MAVVPIAYVSGTERDEELKVIADKARDLKELSKAGEIDPLDKKAEMLVLGGMIRHYYELVAGGNPFNDLVFLFRSYDIIGSPEFDRIEGEDP